MVINYFAEPDGNDNMSGLISKIKNENPGFIGSTIFTAASNLNFGKHENVLTWSSCVQTASIASAFLQINFRNLFLSPTHYSNRGWTGLQYAKKWSVYGITITNREVLLSNDTAEETGYCGTGKDCSTSESFLYKLKYPKNNLVAIKWVPTLGSLNGYYYFQSYGIELFGKLSSKNAGFDCFTCKRNSRLIIDRCSVFIYLFTISL